MIEEDRMSQSWPVVALGEVIEHRKEFIEIQDAEQYKRCRVQLHAKGIVLRDVVSGADIRTKRQQVCRTGEFLVAEIDAKLGGFGIVPEELEDAIVSSHYFLFTVNETKLERSFLDYYIRTAIFQDQVTAQGSTNYAAIRPQHVLEYTIPLPPLDEQRRIVARIEALASRVAEAQRLRAEAIAQVETFVQAKEMQIWPNAWLNDAPTLADITKHLARGRQSKQGESNHYLIKTRHVQMGKYVRSDMMLDTDVAEKVSADACAQYGDILIACSAAGCLGRVAQFDVTDQMASTDTHVAIARANPEIVLPEYLYAYLRGAQGQYQLRSRERGDWQREKISFRLTELNMNDLQKVPVPIPSLDEQSRIVASVNELHAKVSQLHHYQTSTQVELDALLPAILDKAFRGEL